MPNLDLAAKIKQYEVITKIELAANGPFPFSSLLSLPQVFLNEVLRPDLKKATEVKAKHMTELQEFVDLENNLLDLKQV